MANKTRPKCPKCGHCVFDIDYYGWDGYARVSCAHIDENSDFCDWGSRIKNSDVTRMAIKASRSKHAK